jgi:hypothetical protein
MLKKGAGSGQVLFLLAEQKRGWSLMIFCARATRGLRMTRGSRQTVLLARRTRTIRMCSSDARSEEQSAYSLWESWGIRRPSLGLVARLGQSIVKQSEGRAGEKVKRNKGRSAEGWSHLAALLLNI